MTVYFCMGCLKDFEGDVFTAYDRPTGRVLCITCRQQKQESPEILESQDRRGIDGNLVDDGTNNKLPNLSKIKLKGGWSMDRERFSDDARRVLGLEIISRRQCVRLPEGTLRGSRFNNVDDILARLESRFTEEEFMACPGPSIDAALIDAAQSDYWYKFEKDYEWPDTPETEIDDDE